MKARLFLLIFCLPLWLFGQQVYYSHLESFPNFQLGLMNGLPTPIQYNRANVFGPKVDLNCLVSGYAITNYNCAVYTSVGPGVINPVIDTLEEQAVFLPNTWVSPTNMTTGSFFLMLNYNFTDFGALESYQLVSDVSYSSYFMYDENNLLESFQSSEGFGASAQQYNFDFVWSNNNQRCEVIKNNAVISSFKSDSLGNSVFQFDSLGKLINYSNISDYSTFHTGPPLNDGYIRVDSMNFQYDELGKILSVGMIQYYNYLLGSSNPDSLIIINSNRVETNLNYLWIEENQVELTLNVINNANESINYFDIFHGSPCLNEQIVSKIIYTVDSNEYIISTSYLDSNTTTLYNQSYHFCDEDTVIYGCTDSNACNYDSLANYSGTVLTGGNVGQAPCIYNQDYVDCDGNCYDDSDSDGVCDELEVLGCYDNAACNFNAFATDDDGSCTYAETYYDCNGMCLNDSDEDGVCDEFEVFGCTDSLSCSYDSTATSDDASCFYPDLYFDCNGNCINDFDGDGECDELDFDDGLGVNELNGQAERLIKMVDVLGKEHQTHQTGKILFYIYNNGKIIKRLAP